MIIHQSHMNCNEYEKHNIRILCILKSNSCVKHVPLSMLVLNSRDQHVNLWLPQTMHLHREQPYNNIFFQSTTINF